MKFEKRKLYAHGQNASIVMMSIPKLVCEDMQLTKDTLVDLDYQPAEKKVVITISEDSNEEINE